MVTTSLGRSPTIVCDDFDVDEAASRILYFKYSTPGRPASLPTT
jgi:acyl-CoA reductase-like NAD-dependent aldehyde dehydrogenase